MFPGESTYPGASTYPGVGEASTGGGWLGLLDIYQDAAEEAAFWRAQPPVACPNDGEPLTTGPDGRLFCKFDGWRPPA